MNVLEKSYTDFFTQRLVVRECSIHSWKYCEDLCRDKKVLHIGCSDYPFSNPSSTLHASLSKIAKELHGCDVNGIEELRSYIPGVYFNSIDDVKDGYDVILVPNIIEHLINPGIFIEALFKIPFKQMFVLVPNYRIWEQAKYENGAFLERIHPDHYAWYSPYTLFHLFSSYLDTDMETELLFFDHQNMIGLQINK